MSTDADGATLVRFLQELGGSQCTLSPQRLVVLLAEATHPLEGTNYQCDGCQLGFGVTNLILVERESLGTATKAMGIWGWPNRQ